MSAEGPKQPRSPTYKVGDKYIAARSNEFGYANCEIIPAAAELSPLR